MTGSPCEPVPCDNASIIAMTGSIRRWESECRYYMAWVQRDLFGGLELATVWGGKDNRLGGVRYLPVASLDAAAAALVKLDRRRRARRYRRINVA